MNGALLPEVQVRRAARPRAARPARRARSSGSGHGTRRGAAVRRHVNAKVTLFNGTLAGGNPTIIIYSVPDLGPVMTFDGVLKAGAGRRTATCSTSTMPPIQTLPSAPDASVTFFDATTRDLTVRRRGPHDPLHRQPRCSATERSSCWTGSSATRAASRTPCSSASRCAAARAAPRRRPSLQRRLRRSTADCRSC